MKELEKFWQEVVRPNLQFMWSSKVVLIRYGIVTPLLIILLFWLARSAGKI